ncbi:unnamed protein product [Oikopleura dioica]|uniref:Uncharacterized protein n=1 Tax=Oikopleura dioica TaxID=34765 RepID=E4WRL4_OIKDI|nr:unnamed protein product [Oikopleura dioica]CBY33036.1 unnamed protein product [Oikopleura dioica]
MSQLKGLSRKNTQRLSFIHSILVVPPVASALALLICIAPRLNDEACSHSASALLAQVFCFPT